MFLDDGLNNLAAARALGFIPFALAAATPTRPVMPALPTWANYQKSSIHCLLRELRDRTMDRLSPLAWAAIAIIVMIGFLVNLWMVALLRIKTCATSRSSNGAPRGPKHADMQKLVRLMRNPFSDEQEPAGSAFETGAGSERQRRSKVNRLQPQAQSGFYLWRKSTCDH
jgi:hypothetical protein